MKAFLKRATEFPAFALLMGLFPIAVLWATNKLQVKPQAVWLPLLATLVFVCAVWLLCALALRSFKRGNLLATLIFLFFFSFGHIYDLIEGKKILGMEVGFVKLLAVYALLFIILLVFFKKNHNTFACHYLFH